MPTNSYDLVVLGDDLASLVCATLCARRQLRTLVLGSERGARYTLGPHKLPVETSTWPTLPGNGGERVLKEVHGELALRKKLRDRGNAVAAQLVVGRDLRVDLGIDRLAGELEREVGPAEARAWIARWDQTSELARLFDPLFTSEHAFPGVGFFERREVAKLVERVADQTAAWWNDVDPKSAAAWRNLAAIALRHPEPPPAAIVRAIEAWRAGPVSLRGDGDAIRELLVEKLTTAGGELRIGRITELGVSWGKIASITLSSGDDIGAGQVVSSRPPAELVELLGKKAPKRLAELAEAMSIVGYRYTLNVVLDEAGIPEHMAPNVAVVVDPEGAASGANAFAIQLGEVDDAGRVIATITAVLPAEGTTPEPPERLAKQAAALRAELWRCLGDVMPFFERHLVLAHSPFEATPPQVPGGRGSYDVPKHLPLAMSPIWRTRTDETATDQISGGGLPYVTGLKNLTLTGDQILPALGIDGQLVAGWSAAKVASAIAGKKKDYLRDEVVGAAG